MTQIEIDYAHPRHQGIQVLLKQHHTLMQSLFPVDANHFLDTDALCHSDIHFIAARVNGVYQACGAFKIQNTYAEIKSMFTAPDARGSGLADQILAQLIDRSRALGLFHLRLETGVGLDAAHRLYRRHGFETCGPFGDYTANPYSIFMERSPR